MWRRGFGGNIFNRSYYLGVIMASPFSRAMAMAAAISVIMSDLSIPQSLKQLKLGELGTYKSRGKGTGKVSSTINACTDWKARGYTSAREIARHARQKVGVPTKRKTHTRFDSPKHA